MAHSLLTASAVRFLSVVFLGAVFVSCQQPAKTFDAEVGAISLAGAEELTPVTTTVQFQSERQALAPLHTRRLDLTATAGVEVTALLPVPFSTRGIWARVTASSQERLTIGGRTLSVATQSLTYFPLTARRLAFTAERDGVVSIEPVVAVDTWGGGFTVSTAATPTELDVTGARRFSEVVPPGADDTFSRLIALDVTATAGTQLFVGACGATETPVTTEAFLEVAPGQTARTLLWLVPGPVCFSSTSTSQVKLLELGRIKRFATSTLRAVIPVTVLDTQGEVAWRALPLADQELRVSLSGLSGQTTTTHQLFSITVADGAEFTVGVCGATPQTLRGTGTVLLRKSEALCIKPGAHHVDAKLIAVVTDRSEDVTCSAARPPAPTCAATDILGKLNCIPGLRAQPFTSQRPRPGTEMYLLRFTQPSNHFDPSGATFEQRLLLTVRDENAPLVLHTTGYELFDSQSDLASNFPVNELEVEHRFYEDSTPATVDYSLLTIMQSAADSHRIFEALGALFPAPWANTGHSKGGMTALFHRRYFPCDVAATAGYVTPISRSKQDPRFGPWLAELGGPSYATCRGVLNDLERAVMSRKAELAPTLRGTYARIGSRTNALWAAMSGSSLWGVFQYGLQEDTQRGCPAYESFLGDPDFPALYAEQYAGYGESYSDQALERGEVDPYTYQTQVELGSPGGNRAHLEEFGPIPTLPDDGELIFNGLAVPEFEQRAMADVLSWLQTHGERFVFIYGGFDPWTAAQVDITGTRDAVKIIVPGQNHGVGLEDATGPEAEQAWTYLETWLGVSRNPKRKASELRANGNGPLQYRDVMHRHRL